MGWFTRAATVVLGGLLLGLPGAAQTPTDRVGRSTVGDYRTVTSASGTRELCTQAMLVGEYVTNVTTTIATVSVIPSGVYDIRLNYGTDPSMGTRTTATATTDDTREDFDLTGLTAGTRYYYQVECKPTGAVAWGVREQNNFRTLRSAGASFRIAIVADTHASQRWQTANCGDNTDPLWPRYATYEQTLENISTWDPDLVLDLGDTGMSMSTAANNCQISAEDMGDDTVGAMGGANTTAQRQAELRYRVLLQGGGDSPIGYRRALRLAPLIYVLGNHDGEGSGMGDATGTHGYYTGHATIPDTDTASEAARLLTFPNPTTAYPGGDASGNYFTLATGDLRIVVIDNFKYVSAIPANCAGWTLGGNIDPGGAGQLGWLEDTLAAATEPHIIVASHHLNGGVEAGATYWYGRGFLAANATGSATGDFCGEQDTLQTLFETYGVDAHFYGHDHITAFGEKFDSNGATGILYAVCGQPKNIAAPNWTTIWDVETSYDGDQTAVATVGPVQIDTASAARTFTCTGCDFTAAGFVANGILRASSGWSDFTGAADADKYSITTVATTVVTVEAATGDVGDLGDETGSGDEVLVMTQPDYRETTRGLGTTDQGFCLLDVNGPGPMTLRYIKTDTSDATLNNTVVLTREID